MQNSFNHLVISSENTHFSSRQFEVTRKRLARSIGVVCSLSMMSSGLLLTSCGSSSDPEEIANASEYDVPQLVNKELPPIQNNQHLPDPIEDFNPNNDPSGPTKLNSATPYAKPVPGRPGFVFNPFTQNMVDVSGIPAETKVRDPQDADETHAFYVP